MPRTYRVKADSGDGQHVFLAVAAYSDVSAGFCSALFASQNALSKAGIAVDLEILSENCHVDDARNALVRDFLESDCTDLVFLDADVSWNADSLVRLVQADRDVVAGLYPLKEGEPAYPVRMIPGEIWADGDGLIEVESVPTGFLRIRRSVLETLSDIAPGYIDKGDEPGRRKAPLIFERTLEDDRRWGGDYTFCRKWRATGGKIFIDPEIHFEHYGQGVWPGSYGAHLRKINGLSIGRALALIGMAKESPMDFAELVDVWGNPKFSASPELLQIAVMMARDTTEHILECGSGISTAVLAAAAPDREVWALEHDPDWAAHTREMLEREGIKNAHVLDAPLIDYGEYDWYTLPPELPTEFGLVLCDGPPRITHESRTGFIPQIKDRLSAGCAVVVDDAESLKDLTSESEAGWGTQLGAEFYITGPPHRKYAVTRIPDKGME